MFGALGNFLHQIRINFVGVNNVSTPAKQVTNDLNKVKSAIAGVTSFAKRLAVAGVITGALFAIPAKSAIAFETGMVDVRKTTNLAFSDIEEGITGIVDNGVPTTIQGLQTIAATAGQLGITGAKNIFSFTQAVAKMEAVSDLSAEGASSAFAGFANVFKIPLQNVENMGSSINELSNTTNASAQFIVDAMARIGRPIENLTFQQVAGLGATLADMGLGAERGGTALRNVFLRMQTQAGQAAKIMGVSVGEWQQRVQTDGIGAFTDLLGKIKEINPAVRATAIKGIFEQEAVETVQRLAGGLDKMRTNLGLSNSAFAENISLTNELKNVQDSAGGKLTVIGNQIKLIAASLGTPLLDPLKAILDGVVPIARAFRDFARAHPTFLKFAGVIGLLAATTFVLGGAFLFLAGKVAFAVIAIGGLFGGTGFVALANWLQLARFGVIALGKAFLGLLANPVVLAIAAIAGGLYLAYRHSETFRNAVNGVVSVLRDKFEVALTRISYAIGFVFGYAYGTWIKLKRVANDVFPYIGAVLQVLAGIFVSVLKPAVMGTLALWTSAWPVIAVIFKGAWNNIVAIVRFAWNLVSGIVGTMVTTVAGIIKAGAQLLLGDWRGAWATIGEVVDANINLVVEQLKNFGNLISSLWGNFKEAGFGLITAFVEGIKTGWTTLKDGLGGVLGKVLAYLPGSDARLGPLSNLTGRGMAFSQTFAKGMDLGAPAIASSANEAFGPVFDDFDSGGSTTNNTRSSRQIVVNIQPGAFVVSGANAEQTLADFKKNLLAVLQDIGDELEGVSLGAA
ncbi:phage tail tape measure protein [bacterium]|nr:phage tail tape measure protein [bacterium]